jgi:hypothetical protein
MLAIVTALVVLARAVPGADSSVVIPAGTRIEAQLEQPVSTRTAAANDSIIMRVSHELLVGSSLALPAGTRIIARLDSITNASGWRTHLDLHMHLARMVFADRYSIAVTGGAVGATVGLFVDVIGAPHGNDLIAERGAPMVLVLDAPLVLGRVELLAAGDSAAARSPFSHTTKPKRCFVAGSPGTPDVTIPGSPPAPGIDGQPATPGSPAIVMPGIPPTPDAWVPC